MKKFVVRVLLTSAIIFGVAFFLPNLIEVDGFESAVVAALFLALVNGFIRPVVRLLTFPVNWLSLGLFSLVVNALMLYIVESLVPGFHLAGFWQAIVAAIIISSVSSALSD